MSDRAVEAVEKVLARETGNEEWAPDLARAVIAAYEAVREQCDEWKVGRASLGAPGHHCAVHEPARCLLEKDHVGEHVFRMVGRRACACTDVAGCVWLADRETQVFDSVEAALDALPPNRLPRILAEIDRLKSVLTRVEAERDEAREERDARNAEAPEGTLVRDWMARAEHLRIVGALVAERKAIEAQRDSLTTALRELVQLKREKPERERAARMGHPGSYQQEKDKAWANAEASLSSLEDT